MLIRKGLGAWPLRCERGEWWSCQWQEGQQRDQGPIGSQCPNQPQCPLPGSSICCTAPSPVHPPLSSPLPSTTLDLVLSLMLSPLISPPNIHTHIKTAHYKYKLVSKIHSPYTMHWIFITWAYFFFFFDITWAYFINWRNGCRRKRWPDGSVLGYRDIFYTLSLNSLLFNLNAYTHSQHFLIDFKNLIILNFISNNYKLLINSWKFQESLFYQNQNLSIVKQIYEHLINISTHLTSFIFLYLFLTIISYISSCYYRLLSSLLISLAVESGGTKLFP